MQCETRARSPQRILSFLVPSGTAGPGGRSAVVWSEQVHAPAAADVGARTPEVAEDFWFGAAGFFQGVSEHRQAGAIQLAGRQDALVGGGLCEGQDRWGQPGG